LTSLLFDVGVPIRKFDASLNFTLAVARAFAGVEDANVHTAERPMAAIVAKSAVRLNMVVSHGSVRAICTLVGWLVHRFTRFPQPLSSSLQP
jgi:hypothetical protein